jgi:hypothetical protein
VPVARNFFFFSGIICGASWALDDLFFSFFRFLSRNIYKKVVDRVINISENGKVQLFLEFQMGFCCDGHLPGVKRHTIIQKSETSKTKCAALQNLLDEILHEKLMAATHV